MLQQDGGVRTAEITWEDLLRVLEERPDWRERVRQVVLTSELLSLPEAIRELRDAQYQTALQIRELAEIQRRHEERLVGVEERLDRLEEAQRQTTLQIRELREAQEQTNQQIRELREAQERTNQQIRELWEALEQTNQQIRELREAQERTNQQIRELWEALEQTNQQIRELREAQQQTTLQIQELQAISRNLLETVRVLSIDMARMKGFYLEMQYRQKASAYFGRLLRSIRVMTPADIEDRLEPDLTPEEIEDLMMLDLLVSGRLRRDPRQPEVTLALEISFTVDKEDIQRARKRAALLRKAGFRAIPAVAGVEVPPEAIDLARMERVVVFEDGRVFLWDEIVQEVL